MLPDVAASLFKAPAALTLPVFKLPQAVLADVSKLLSPLSTLATIVLPDVSITPSSISVTVPDLAFMVPNVTLVGLSYLAEQFVDRLPQLPSINLALINMSMNDVITEWAQANLEGLGLPRIVVNDVKLNALKAFIPGLTLPSIIVPNVSFSLFQKPAGLVLPVFQIPTATLQSVTLLLPQLSSLSTILLPSKITALLPELIMPNVTISGLTQFVSSMQSSGAQTSSATNTTVLSSMSLTDVVAQWLAASELKLPVPSLTVNNITLNGEHVLCADRRCNA